MSTGSVTSAIRLASERPVDWVLDGEFGGARTEVEIKNLRERIPILLREPPGQGQDPVS